MQIGIQISYIGRGYIGWQRQSEEYRGKHTSIQEVVEDVVTTLMDAKQKINVTSMSRTDAGTHALWQFARFKVETMPFRMQELCRLLNEKLPESIRIQNALVLDSVYKLIPYRATYKKYIYYIQQANRPSPEYVPYSWFVAKKLNIFKIRAALDYILGTHDFRPFSQGMHKGDLAYRNTVRTIIEAKIVPRRSVEFSLDLETAGIGEIIDDQILNPDTGTTNDDDPFMLCVEITGTGFLKHMVRRIVGTLRWVGEGKHAPEIIQEIFQSSHSPGPSVNARGLWLYKTWITDEDYRLEQRK